MPRNVLIPRLILAFLVLLLPALVHAQNADKFTARLNDDEKKDLKALQDDWNKHTKMSDFSSYQAKSLVVSQMVLGRLGYGASFTGQSDEPTRQAIRRYQTERDIPQSGEIDAETFWSLSRDDGIADERVTSMAPFDLHWYSDYVMADGAWDRMNDKEGYLQSTDIECTKAQSRCTEADAMLLFNIVQAKQTDFLVTKWDEYEIVAEDTTPNCERDELRINRQEKTVTMLSVPTYKDKSCKGLLGKPETVTYRLISGTEIGKDRAAVLQNRRKTLYLISPGARAILDKKD